MHTIINPNPSSSPVSAPEPAPAGFRKPVYDCQAQSDALKLVVYVPGVDAAGIGIEARGPDLVITARKTRLIRVDWEPLQSEKSHSDYRLRLRLGRGIAYEAMQAEIHQGILTVILPKLGGGLARNGGRWPRVT